MAVSARGRPKGRRAGRGRPYPGSPSGATRKPRPIASRARSAAAVLNAPVVSAASHALRPDDLRGIGLFGALSDDVLAYLGETLASVDVGAGEIVFREGDSGRELFVVLEGRLEVLKRSSAGAETPVAT